MKAATICAQSVRLQDEISIHAAREGGDRRAKAPDPRRGISIHAAREGGDGCHRCSTQTDEGFQSTPPVKAATNSDTVYFMSSGISIHAAREGGDAFVSPLHDKDKTISIHAAREGGDGYIEFIRRKGEISIHAAREGGDNPALLFVFRSIKFQSTPPVKAATVLGGHTNSPEVFQSTPPVKAATQRHRRRDSPQAISIHAAREGGDLLAFP